MRQADIFLGSEGDAWLERNRHNLGYRDPVFDAIKDVGIKPKIVCEIGCANGWRLANLRDQYGCDVFGIEPSKQAAKEAAELHIPVSQSTAAEPAAPADYDLLIYGFCLYLTDPADWLRIAYEGDTMVTPGGHLIIHDFADVFSPYARRYKHHAKILSYHFDFAKLWLAHPLYTVIRREIDHGEMVTVLRKCSADNFEVRP